MHMLLVGQAKVFKHGKAKTLYITIPAKVADDSQFSIKQGYVVEVRFDPKEGVVTIKTPEDEEG